MIELEIFTKNNLLELVSSERFSRFSFLPISPHRALSHVNNPKAEHDDALLILATENGNLAGYLGLLPGEIETPNGKEKIVWLSTLYVDAHFRGKKIAQQLLSRAFDLYEDRVVMTEFTTEAESLYNKTGQFDYLQPKKGKRYYFLSNLQELLPQKTNKAKPFIPLLNAVDLGINTVWRAIQKKQKIADFRFEILSEIDTESKTFIQQFPSHRNAEELAWTMQYPWVLQEKKSLNKYLFSSFAKNKKIVWVKIFDHHNLLECCAMLSIRDGHLKIPYIFHKNNLGNFHRFLGDYLAQESVKMLTCYQTELNDYWQKYALPSLYSKEFERRYMLHKKLMAILPKGMTPPFQDGDGDCVFT